MDDEDRALAAMFAHPPLADAGFSERVLRRVRRRERLRHTLLPAATAAGAMIAFKPLVSLVSGLAGLLQPLFGGTAVAAGMASLMPVVAGWLPWAVLALLTGITTVRLLED